MTISPQAKRLEAAGQVNRRHAFLTRAALTAHLGLSRLEPQATRPGPGGDGLSPALEAIAAVVEAWPHDHGARQRWLGWISRARGLQGARRGPFRAAAAAAGASASE